jgi:type IV fimbrial biogenesis protein FimT
MRQSGATLLELLVVLALSAVLLGMAIPGFAAFTSNSRLVNTTNSMLSSLHLARSEAIKRRARAVLCPSSTGTDCAAEGGWHQGWLLFHDANNNAARDDGETVVLAQAGMPEGFRLTGNTQVSKYISYTPTGAAQLVSGAFQAGTLTVCNESGSPIAARRIIISSTGRPRVVKTTLDACP